MSVLKELGAVKVELLDVSLGDREFVIVEGVYRLVLQVEEMRAYITELVNHLRVLCRGDTI